MDKVKQEIYELVHLYRYDVDRHKVSSNGTLSRAEIRASSTNYKFIIVFSQRGGVPRSFHYQIKYRDSGFWTVDKTKFFANTPPSYFVSQIEKELDENG